MSYSDNNSFEKILDRALENDLLVNVDKRVGSIIYDALAPVCMELADAYVKMDILEKQTYLMTATGTNLNKRVYDYGMSRSEATQALRIAEFKKYETDTNGHYILDENGDKILVDMDVSVGSRFTVPSDSETTYIYIGLMDGYKILQCEQTGTKGNEHIGQVLPLTPIYELVEANIISTYKYGEDEETDDELRERVKEYLNYMPYGGNISDYIEKVNAIDGVGNTKVFPAWQYNGSVLLSVVDPTFHPISSEFIGYLKNIIDPEEESGQGIGIAPIGHFVTITTPVEQTVDVSLTLDIQIDAEIGEIHQQVEEIIENYFDSVRHQFSQNTKLALYRAKVIELILSNIPEILNVTDVLFNDEDEDIVYVDEGQIGMQYLPKLGEVVIN